MNPKTLKGKRVLFIGIGMFAYEEEIRKELESRCCAVDYFIQEGRSKFLKLLFERKYREFHQKKIVSKISGCSYDYVFVIKGDKILPPLQEKINEIQCDKILYLWDSLERSGQNSIHIEYDRIISFDRIDCEKKKFQFLPLFYIPRLLNGNTKEFSALFLGALHSDRLSILNALKPSFEENGVRPIYYVYFPFFSYWVRKLLRRKLWDGSSSGLKITHKRINLEENYLLKSQSLYFIDIHHERQSGLAFGVIEALACKQKIITTNADVKNYPFYSEDNFMIVDRNGGNDRRVNEKFFSNVNVSDELYDSGLVSLREWVDSIFLKENTI